ncbi:aldehyde dehydrogenase family protein [Faecalicatena contorta]|uniref:aldehyde dehydrogenase family protein n=1 Tax=Faecalicatena contorta TaxID=39482 RepID=UPI001F380E6A|nr:aldehyde dehydrogenase family protein [Faecalicatena contorta]MCF2555415.1 aldehyde dehydrogenase EutE [Faecalicatena contorta]
MGISNSDISRFVHEIENELGRPAAGRVDSSVYAGAGEGDWGLFDTAEAAIDAALRAQKKLMNYTLADREKFVSAMRQAARDNAKELAEIAHKETGYGHVEDKIVKNLLAANKTPGTEDLQTIAKTGDDGLMLTEMAPFGVIGAITPSTNPTATVINNGIGMIAAGNAVVFNPHPGAKKASGTTIQLMNQAIVAAGGPENLLCAPKVPTMDTSAVIMNHPRIRLLTVTGGEGVVRVAMKTGKRCIAAGPGNPPVVVDETADIKKAASDIVKGASYENCILCIAEKEVLVVNSVADELIREMVKNGAYLLNGIELEKVCATVMEKNKEGKWAPNKKFVGRDASYILKESGVYGGDDAKVVICDVPFEHPLVMTEMLMPVVPVTRVSNVDEAIEKAVIAENGCHHTAMMHSKNVDNLTKMGRAIDTTIFVKNAPSYAGLAIDGEGYTTLSIATPTGEGLTSAKNFTRSRRCTLSGSFRIV